VRGLSLADAKIAMESKFWGAYRVARAAKICEGGSLTFVSGFLSVRRRGQRRSLVGVTCMQKSPGQVRGLVDF
jgi:hypothetical protein